MRSLNIEEIQRLASEVLRIVATEDEFRPMPMDRQEAIIRETTAAVMAAIKHWRTNMGSLIRGLNQDELETMRELIDRDAIQFYLYEGPKFKI